MPGLSPSNIRNVALVGHHGAGKTTLAEALLTATGAISRQGSVEKGTTVSDFEPEEVARQLSVSLAIAPVMVDGIKINVLDTPGYADFVGDLRASRRVEEGEPLLEGEEALAYGGDVELVHHLSHR